MTYPVPQRLASVRRAVHLHTLGVQMLALIAILCFIIDILGGKASILDGHAFVSVGLAFLAAHLAFAAGLPWKRQ